MPGSAPAPTATTELSPGHEPVRLTWSQPHGIPALSLVNFLLRVVTLGLYHFWGKTEVRRRLWSAARINGEPLAYTGTGGELLRGFLMVFALVVIPAMLISLALALLLGPSASGTIQLLIYVAFFYLTGVAIHRAQRYRLTRTQWRGIRGGMAGNSWRFAWTYFWTGLLIPPTLGWIAPWRTTKLQGLLTNAMVFGDRPFRFDAGSGPLYLRFAGLWIGSLLIVAALAGSYGYLLATIGFDPGDFQPSRTPSPRKLIILVGGIYVALFVGMLIFGVLSAWYRAGLMNHFAAHTSYEDARFSAHADAASLIWLSISNFLILLTGAVAVAILAIGAIGGAAAITGLLGGSSMAVGRIPDAVLQSMPLLVLIVVVAGFGVLGPIAQMRSARYFVQRLSLEGSIPVASIAQAAEDHIKRGEGLAQAFDVDAF